MRHYLGGTVQAFKPKSWWTLFFVPLFLFLSGAGINQHWPTIRDAINTRQQVVVMPEELTIWHALAAVLFGLVAFLVHKEARRYTHAGRLQFDKPHVVEDVPLRLRSPYFMVAGQVIGKIDIASIIVRNVPYDGAEGQLVEDAFVSVEFYNAKTRRTALSFQKARWEENDKPGYQGNPSDHIPDEWNRRNLRPSGESNTINFLIKEKEKDCAYGFRVRSQLKSNWSDEELRLPAGSYVMRLTVFGVGLREPVEQWLAVWVGGTDQSIEVTKCKPLDRSPWLLSEPSK